MKLIILQGPPACGKTTWAKEYIKDETHNETIIISRDSIRESRKEYWEPKKEKWVTEMEEAQIGLSLKHGYDVIVDDTNLNPSTIQRLNEIGNKYSADIEIKSFYIPFEEAVKRDMNEDRKHHVGKKDIKKFYRLYYPEQLEEEMKQYIEHPVYPITEDLPLCVICDIDGTIAWMNGRSPFDYSRVGEDNPDNRLVYLLKQFINKDIELIFLSGREGIEQCKIDTEDWLKKNLGYDNFKLYTRKKGDYRPDEIIKKELFDAYIKDKYYPLCVFDDREKVVNMWRELGLLTCQVEKGDF